MYSDYDWKQEKLVAEDEENVSDMVRLEMEMELEDGEARWWFDVREGWKAGDVED